MQARSPAATHLAYLQIPDRCGSSNRVLWIDQKPRFQCLKADGYGLIDEKRLWSTVIRSSWRLTSTGRN